MQKLVYIILLNFLLISCEDSKQRVDVKIQNEKSFIIHLGDDNNIDMIWVPKGDFMMGSDENDIVKHKNKPTHRVKINEGFWLSKYEITQKQWTWFMKSTLLEQQKNKTKNGKLEVLEILYLCILFLGMIAFSFVKS